MRLALRGEAQLNQRDGFLDRTKRYRVSGSRMAGEIDVFQLGRHLLAHFNRRNHVKNIKDLFDNQLTGDNVKDQFQIGAQVLSHGLSP